MAARFDAVILGAGVAGLGTAVHLARRGQKVLVLSKPLSGEASPAAAGILDPLLEMKAKSPQLELCLAAYRHYATWTREVEKKTRIPLGLSKLGMYYIALDRAQEKDLRQRYEWQRRFFPVHTAGRAEILKAEPAVTAAARFGLFYPTVARIFPRRLVRALRAYARGLGIRVRTVRQAAGIVEESGAVRGVRLGKEFIAARTVVNAMGSWAGARRYAGMRVPVAPARGQILVLDPPRLKVGSVLHTLDGAYAVPWEKERMLVGSTVEFVGFRPGVTRGGVARIRRRIERLVPGLRRARVAESWTGLRPFPKDRLPLLGPTRVRGYYLATGFFRSGILLGWHAGSLLAKAILSGKMPSELRPFTPERFP